MQKNKYNQQRVEELMGMIEDNEIYRPLILSLVFFEQQMNYLSTLPTKKDKRVTTAHKMKKEIYQQYLNGFKILQKAVIGEDTEDKLFEWLRDNNEWDN